jgi:hypothetical protein
MFHHREKHSYKFLFHFEVFIIMSHHDRETDGRTDGNLSSCYRAVRGFTVKISIYLDVALRRLVNRYKRFGGACCLHLQYYERVSCISLEGKGRTGSRSGGVYWDGTTDETC